MRRMHFYKRSRQFAYGDFVFFLKFEAYKASGEHKGSITNVDTLFSNFQQFLDNSRAAEMKNVII